MKKILVTLLTLAIAPAVMAQGQFNYNNFAADAGTGFVNVNGVAATDTPAIFIDIFWSPVGAGTFQAAGLPVQLGLLGPGYFDGGAATVPAGAAVANVDIQYRVVTPGWIGSSATVVQPLAYAPNSPGDAVLPANWNIVPVPEPSTDRKSVV